MAQLALPREPSSRVALAIYKPITGYDIHDALRHITTALIPAFHKAGTTKAAVLNSVNGSWVAIFSVWKAAGISEKDDSTIADKLGKDWASSVVRVVEWRWFHFNCEEHRDESFAQLRFGDIVNLRRIQSSRRKQEVLAYSCLAVMKAYFKQTKGIRSYTFYKSLDGKRIIGLGLWDNIQSASALLKESSRSLAEPYWYGLGAKTLKYAVCQVVFIFRRHGGFKFQLLRIGCDVTKTENLKNCSDESSEACRERCAHVMTTYKASPVALRNFDFSDSGAWRTP